MKRLVVLCGVLVALLQTGAYSSPDVAESKIAIRLGETKEVQGIRITPLKIVEDSTCPSGAQCAWAGRLIVSVKLEAGKKSDVVAMQLADAQSKEMPERTGPKFVVTINQSLVRLIGMSEKSEFTFLVTPKPK